MTNAQRECAERLVATLNHYERMAGLLAAFEPDPTMVSTPEEQLQSRTLDYLEARSVVEEETRNADRLFAPLLP